MRSKKNGITLFTVFYTVIFISVVFLVTTQQRDTEAIVKLCLMPTLFIMYLTYTNKVNYYYLVILGISWVGDYGVSYNNLTPFLYIGMNAFTIANIIYIWFLRKELKKVPTDVVIYSSVPFLISIGIVFYLINEGLGEFFYYILIHGIVVSILGTIVFLNFMYNNSKANFWMFIGVFMFIIADCLFAIFRFFDPKNVYIVVVTSLYSIAQYIICRAMIKKSCEVV